MFLFFELTSSLAFYVAMYLSCLDDNGDDDDDDYYDSDYECLELMQAF